MSAKIKYTVSQFYRGNGGFTYSRRVSMRALSLETAQRTADKYKGGFVCAVGSSVPVYAGKWPL